MLEAKNRKEKPQQPQHPSLSNPALNSPNMMPNVVYNFGAPPPGMPQHPFSTTSISGGAPPIEQCSSPPQRDGDDDYNMRAYFDWLSTRFPIHKARFLDIKDTVTENGWGFSDSRAVRKSNGMRWTCLLASLQRSRSTSRTSRIFL